MNSAEYSIPPIDITSLTSHLSKSIKFHPLPTANTANTATTAIMLYTNKAVLVLTTAEGYSLPKASILPKATQTAQPKATTSPKATTLPKASHVPKAAQQAANG